MGRVALALIVGFFGVVAPARAAVLRDVVLVANAEGGTVAIVDARTFALLRTIDVVPDGREATLGEDDPAQALAGQRIVEAAGGENLAQDQDVSPDGRTLYVSRGHRGDVAAFDIDSGKLKWKVRVSGLRSDHMTISPDGSRLYVSALTSDRVEVIDTGSARVVGSFPTGEWPHDNHLSHDGKLVYNASIGNIVTPRETRAAKPGTYRLTVADASSLRVLRTVDFEDGIRPYVLTHDEQRMFAQLSEFHGLVEIDPAGGAILRRVALPIDPGATEDDYDFEAPHHGLALSGDESLLCAAGRASDYVALVSTATLAPVAILDVDDAPGWAATSPDGRFCFVPNTRADTLSVISFERRREVARLRVGDGPKQIEAARLPLGVVDTPPRAASTKKKAKPKRCRASSKARSRRARRRAPARARRPSARAERRRAASRPRPRRAASRGRCGSSPTRGARRAGR